MATASLCSWTFSRNLTARSSFQPLMACAVSRVFLKDTRRYAPRARADFAGWISVAAYRTYMAQNVSMAPDLIPIPPVHLSIHLAIQTPFRLFESRIDCSTWKSMRGIGLLSIATWLKMECAYHRVVVWRWVVTGDFLMVVVSIRKSVLEFLNLCEALR
jgi:hypothetical protein